MDRIINQTTISLLDWDDLFQENQTNRSQVEELVKVCHEFAYENKHSLNSIRSKIKMILRGLEYDKRLLPNLNQGR
jgi:hypothetical protein